MSVLLENVHTELDLFNEVIIIEIAVPIFTHLENNTRCSSKIQIS